MQLMALKEAPTAPWNETFPVSIATLSHIVAHKNVLFVCASVVYSEVFVAIGNVLIVLFDHRRCVGEDDARKEGRVRALCD